MKRTPLKRKTPLRAKSWWNPPRTALRRTKLRVVGHSTASDLKQDIQDLLRQVVMKRDGGCVLRDVRHCGGELDTEGVVIQADHLISRSNSATYADSRLVVCICTRCHGWKHYHKEEYDELVKTVLSDETIELWDKCQKDSWNPTRKYSADWKVHIIQLKQELKTYE